MQRPIVTFTTDFGTQDAYVAAMKAAVLRECPDARLIDITHNVPRHDILAGSIVLERAWTAFARGFGRVVHLAVVDPGVGTERDIVLTDIGGSMIVCPDNGLLTWIERRWPGLRGGLWRLTELPPSASAVFHGRDVMAPLAGRIAAGSASPPRLPTEPKSQPVLLNVVAVNLASGRGQVIHVDLFGNCTTNLLSPPGKSDNYRVAVAGRDLGPIRRTYGDVDPGQALALIGSSDLLEIAVHNGSAATALGLRPGADVQVSRA